MRSCLSLWTSLLFPLAISALPIRLNLSIDSIHLPLTTATIPPNLWVPDYEHGTLILPPPDVTTDHRR